LLSLLFESRAQHTILVSIDQIDGDIDRVRVNVEIRRDP
jgi:hypothetical protein